MTWFFLTTTQRQERALYTQHPYHCRLDWGRRGVRQAAERGDILVIVDTLSFSTAVVTAVHYGGLIYPCSLEEDTAALAQQIGGEAAVSRRDVPERGRFSLSPRPTCTWKLGRAWCWPRLMAQPVVAMQVRSPACWSARWSMPKLWQQRSRCF